MMLCVAGVRQTLGLDLRQCPRRGCFLRFLCAGAFTGGEQDFLLIDTNDIDRRMVGALSV